MARLKLLRFLIMGQNIFILTGTPMQPDYILDGDQLGKLVLKTAKVDYVHPLKNQARLEAGGKISFVSSDNDAKFFDASSGTPIVDVKQDQSFLL
jgi:hypothetical protein